MEKYINLKNYFIEEIMRVSEQEVACLDQELTELKQERMQMMINQVAQESNKQQAYLTNEMRLEHKKRVSKLKEQTKLAFYEYRNELVECLFQSFLEQITSYQNSDEYPKMLKTKLDGYQNMHLEQFVVKLAKKDEKHQALFASYGFSQIQLCEEYMGGFILYNEKAQIMIDETIDAKFEEAKKNFYQTSNFMV